MPIPNSADYGHTLLWIQWITSHTQLSLSRNTASRSPGKREALASTPLLRARTKTLFATTHTTSHSLSPRSNTQAHQCAPSRPFSLIATLTGSLQPAFHQERSQPDLRRCHRIVFSVQLRGSLVASCWAVLGSLEESLVQSRFETTFQGDDVEGGIKSGCLADCEWYS